MTFSTRCIRYLFAYNAAMEQLPPTRVLELIAIRVRKRIVALERVGTDGYGMVIHELRVILDLLERGARYLSERK
jgi:hypothetical protein